MSKPTFKVFVGNLSFKTKAEELAAEFSSAGKVVGANIIARGPRSLGYGFVEMETEEDAHQAVALLNKKSIDSREINVEVAKPRDDSKIAERRSAQPSGEGGDAPAPRRGRGGRRGGRGGRGRGGRGGRGGRAPRAEVGTAGETTPNQSDNNNNADNNNSGTNNEQPPRRRYRPRSRSGGNAAGNGSQEGGAPARGGGRGGARGGRGGRGGRFPRAPREDNRTPSPTTLFVANLPFSMDDNGLLEIFKAHNPTKAHVVLNRNNRSKGFGFVEFANQEDQQAAVNAEKKSVDNRELIVKVALTSDLKPDTQSEATSSPQEPEKTEEVKEAPKTN